MNYSNVDSSMKDESTSVDNNDDKGDFITPHPTQKPIEIETPPRSTTSLKSKPLTSSSQPNNGIPNYIPVLSDTSNKGTSSVSRVLESDLVQGKRIS